MTIPKPFHEWTTIAYSHRDEGLKTDSTVYLCYRFREATVVGDKWLCVVTKYLEDDAFVITAYLTDKLKQGEQRVYPTFASAYVIPTQVGIHSGASYPA